MCWICVPCGLEFHTSQLLQKHKEKKNCMNSKSTCQASSESTLTCDTVSMGTTSQVQGSNTEFMKSIGQLSLPVGSLCDEADGENKLQRNQCNLCNKTFSCSKRLSRHMQLHTRDKPYQCMVCSKGFSESCNLAAHMLTHWRQTIPVHSM